MTSGGLLRPLEDTAAHLREPSLAPPLQLHGPAAVSDQIREGMNQSSSVVVHRTLIISLAPEPYVFVLSLIELSPG